MTGAQTRNVVVVDYGRGNLRSITRALEAVGASPSISSDPADVAGAERLLLPGVGAFGDGMEGLKRRGLVDPIRRFCSTGRPFLGICLGMQLLMSEGTEFGRHEGLGLVPGAALKLPEEQDGRRVKVPHIGWNVLESPADGRWRGSPVDGLAEEARVYFVHSFAAEPADARDVLAVTPFAGRRFCSALRRANVLGFQFHPEKSGPAGLDLLRRWVSS